jgi:hypothetical protein
LKSVFAGTLAATLAEATVGVGVAVLATLPLIGVTTTGATGCEVGEAAFAGVDALDATLAPVLAATAATAAAAAAIPLTPPILPLLPLLALVLARALIPTLLTGNGNGALAGAGDEADDVGDDAPTTDAEAAR